MVDADGLLPGERGNLCMAAADDDTMVSQVARSNHRLRLRAACRGRPGAILRR